ncbi:tyrosine-type recombinase/integrase [Tautonia plasticadhaerens]|uniref:Site-specific tyrosine recombinase XerC n=1 Tax=Tautonia plasticadhaerens TaxID=2527974 RepID=A0A518GYT8_9BACT|nr:site-specific integrase [Tautonia plasticadhaerens]QDV33713.1 site-specific tyrosine recombinase XerC [Tautonia plasticadhaerens]
MASLQKKGNCWYCQFYWRRRRHTFSVGRVTPAQAEARASRAQEIVDLLERGVLKLPDGVDVAAFVRHDGQPPAPLARQMASQTLTLAELRDAYLSAHGAAHEAKSLYTARIHLDHVVETLGAKFDPRTTELADLQRHVDRRCPGVSPVTAAKELSTLRTAWNWGVRLKLLSGTCPVKGLVYPKVDEKPPFQTRSEIERQLDGLDDTRRDELWDALDLTLPEIEAFLGVVRSGAAHPWIFPLVATAAHAGLRRSELVRARKADVDLDALVLTVRERKRIKGKRTTRRVSLSTALAGILEGWLAEHPGGPSLFAHAEEVARSKKRSRTTGHATGDARPSSLKGRLEGVTERARPGILPLTEHEVSDHFRRTITGTAWSIMPGLHCLRHSFISACASKGLDQRIIDEWVGHQTDEQRRRYRHLYPSVQREAMKSVFG